MDPNTIQKLLDTVVQNRDQMAKTQDQIANLVNALQARFLPGVRCPEAGVQDPDAKNVVSVTLPNTVNCIVPVVDCNDSIDESKVNVADNFDKTFDVNAQLADNVQQISLNMRKNGGVNIYKADTDIHVNLRKSERVEQVFIKDPGADVQEFPEVMNPSEDSRIAVVNNIRLFATNSDCLNDNNLLESNTLSDLKLENPKLKDIFDEAVNAESRLEAFKI